ncbi:chymotrypsin inhibitor-like [Diabrotica virgifera virgifera]|uniref:Chymotrypsin inhibitor-like n=1 Tax=Diabrotica virgifera virgifera TaxID=50390 RepID=A0A6P7FC54_DIAVI|nr:chymotrypsin inhibitor-like [Diabrotica virgifera virgifera]
MKFLILCIVLSVFVTLVYSQTELNCPKNSHQGCVPCCPDPTCSNRKPGCPDIICTEECKPKCRCDDGYIYNDIGIVNGCIKPKNCPKS